MPIDPLKPATISSTVGNPPDDPGDAPAVNKLLPIDPAVAKSPAVVSCHTAAAMADAVGGVVVRLYPPLSSLVPVVTAPDVRLI